jgi:hypothetical protein
MSGRPIQKLAADGLDDVRGGGFRPERQDIAILTLRLIRADRIPLYA